MSLKYKYMHIRATATELAMCLGFIYNGRQREDLHPVETTFGWELCASKVWFNCAWLTLGSKEVDKQECLWLPNTMARNVPCSCCSSFARSTSAHLSTRKSTGNAIWWENWRSRECPRALSQHSCACPIARVEWTRARPQSHPALSPATGSFRCDSNWNTNYCRSKVKWCVSRETDSNRLVLLFRVFSWTIKSGAAMIGVEENAKWGARSWPRTTLEQASPVRKCVKLTLDSGTGRHSRRNASCLVNCPASASAIEC